MAKIKWFWNKYDSEAPSSAGGEVRTRGSRAPCPPQKLCPRARLQSANLLPAQLQIPDEPMRVVVLIN